MIIHDSIYVNFMIQIIIRRTADGRRAADDRPMIVRRPLESVGPCDVTADFVQFRKVHLASVLLWGMYETTSTRTSVLTLRAILDVEGTESWHFADWVLEGLRTSKNAFVQNNELIQNNIYGMGQKQAKWTPGLVRKPGTR